MNEELVDELEKDFRHLLSLLELSHGYDPMNPSFIRTMFVGEMWQLSKKLVGQESDVEEEISGAAKYLSLYKETGESSYKEMAEDELRHAGILIKLHMARTSDADYRKTLEAEEKKRLEMVKTVSTATVPVR